MGSYGTALRGTGEKKAIFRGFLGREVAQAVWVRATEKQPRR